MLNLFQTILVTTTVSQPASQQYSRATVCKHVCVCKLSKETIQDTTSTRPHSSLQALPSYTLQRFPKLVRFLWLGWRDVFLWLWNSLYSSSRHDCPEHEQIMQINMQHKWTDHSEHSNQLQLTMLWCSSVYQGLAEYTEMASDLLFHRPTDDAAEWRPGLNSECVDHDTVAYGTRSQTTVQRSRVVLLK